jgi:Zn-dependent protease with chaperone function
MTGRAGRPRRALIAAFSLIAALRVTTGDRPALGDPAPPSSAPAELAPFAEASPTSAPTSAPTGYSLSPERAAEAIAYSRHQYVLYFVDTLVGLATLVLLLWLRIPVRFRDVSERLFRRRFLQILTYAALLFTALAVLDLPLSLYAHHLERAFGQSIQPWPSWLWDQVKELLLSLVLGVPVLWIFLGLVRRSPRRWWLYTWLLSIPLVVLVTFVAPVVIEPLFNQYRPLADAEPALAADIEEVVVRAGLDIPTSRMFEMEASQKSRQLNAYVTGIGPSQRVVVYDTTVARATPDEIMFVFGHELGHYVLHHIYWGLAFGLAGLFVLLAVAARLLRWALDRFGARLGLRDATDPAALPLLLLIASAVSFLGTPVASGFSRHLEHQADVYGLEVVHDLVPHEQEVAARAFQLLGEDDLADPDPPALMRWWLYDHPPIDERIRFARSYDPWDTGQQPEFVR